ncbi:MAG: phosphoenolpyruvate synthase [Candidatus Wildermuthbacteria bacterium RIFCSPHIGHO2_12_FULL_40_12]|uniref:Phosphoenolpyruvate synthase n=1 Tax=Candidatus Wildermuthbacteria bacterium RIFCSPHIGHO2_12_FULL_40_12 TaxID=1802457 RepID=A0A1G2RFX7_9BACT|nr:MAG: phosphoenolpyruvate synthase [Candidatus Wildermuthbacteria bacterium RIFCSPHIGHO2_12_FULL_40_12]
MSYKNKYILWYRDISARDVSLVGGKNASLGEMFNRFAKPKTKNEKRKTELINVPDGFAFTAKAYWYFIKANNLGKKLKSILQNYDPQSINSLQQVGKKARSIILNAKIPEDLARDIIQDYRLLEKKYGKNISVAVRSSGIAEDSPKTSFAGQFETFLNVKGEKELLSAIKKCLASSFGDRVIAYRDEKKVSHLKFALSIGIQRMVRSDLGSSGIMFTLDTETGFQNVVLVSSIWGVGEMIVKGKVTPDEFYVFKPGLKQGFKSVIAKNLGRKEKKFIYGENDGLKEVSVSKNQQDKFSITEEEVLQLAQWACLIEKHYGAPQDIEWAKDGKTGELFITQSRPETIHSFQTARVYREYRLSTKKAPILNGIAVGNKIGQGKVRVINNVSQINQFQKGEVLVTKMTDPDWVPAMRIASAIVTDEGGKTCHAAIISRELGVPAIVGTDTATKVLKNSQLVTVDCSQGLEGKIFSGKIPFKIKKYNLKNIPKLKTKIMLNIGAPDTAFKSSFLPVAGVGLARVEFILAEKIKIHPLALYHFNKIKNRKVKREIENNTIGYKNKKEFFVDELSEGISQIAAAFYPKPVILRMSDLKSNEYNNLIGGELYEQQESNPMIGWRGASRYADPQFRPAFKMECQAIKRARDVFGLKNIWIMVPFCRTVEEGKKVLALLKKNGLEQKKSGLKIIVMCEIPSNVILADKFLDIFDGMSIGSNDLTQLVLGIDRDSAKIAGEGDERNEAVKEMIKTVIAKCNKRKKYCGICGEAPSIFPEFAEFLVKEGIESISLNADSVIKTILTLAKGKR